MKELRILVEGDTLLPVLYGQLAHVELQRKIRGSSFADADHSTWKLFTDRVEGTTYVTSEEEYTGEGLIKKGQLGLHGFALKKQSI